jgi:hypothetical protein
MFAKTIVDSDAFLDMPLSAQALYFHLSIRADDDGFVNNPKKIQRVINASDDDLKLLIAKRFIIVFESGVIVIKHWKIHNYIQKDRYKETVYREEKNLLEIKKNGAYTIKNSSSSLPDTSCIQNGYSLEAQVRLGKVSLELGKDSMGEKSERPMVKKFTPPTLQQVIDYCNERNKGVDPERWFNFYQAKGWMVGKNKMKDWKAAVRTWENNQKPKRPSGMADLEAIIRGDNLDH